MAGFAVGVVEHDERLGPERVAEGDLLVGLASPGLRSNGYTLARHVLLERAGLDLGAPAWAGADASLADELLRPSVIYTPAVLAALRAAPGAVHAAAHITGGGIAGNLSRVLPSHLDAELDRGTWSVPRLFDEIARLGPVDDQEMARVFNLGLGMVLAIDPVALDPVTLALAAAGTEPALVGRVTAGQGQVHLR